MPVATTVRHRFGAFELHPKTLELFERGRRVRLPEQSARVLTKLVERSGELLTRDELQRVLWPEGSPVDVEHGLNAAVNRARKALGDSAEAPRYIETVARRGYRFVGRIEDSLDQPEPTVSVEPETASPRAQHVSWPLLVALAGVIAVGSVSVLRSPGAIPITSLVVLPLEDLSRDSDGDYFADGMTEALISELATIPDLRIISRTTAMKFRDSDQPIAEIARELRVDSVLEGSLLRSGDHVRMTVRLVAARPEKQLWTGSFERSASEIVSLQKELSRTVAEEMHLLLVPDVEQRLAHARPVDPRAHEYVLRGWYLARKIHRENLEKALSHFQEAATLDPDYAEAHVGIAASLAVLTISGWRDPDETYRAQKEALAMALSLDDRLPVAHAWLAQFKRNAEWDWDGAEESYRRAIELAPGSGYLRTLYGGFLMGHARYDEALFQFERAERLDPLAPTPHCMAGWTLSFQGELARARIKIDRALELDPDHAQAYRALDVFYSVQGRRREAVAAMERAAEVSERAPLVLGRLGSLYVGSGRAPEARMILVELADVPPGRRVRAYSMARIHSALREKDEALGWLEQAFRNREYDLAFLPVGNQFAWLRTEPRFEAILSGLRFRQDRLTQELVVEQ